MKKLSRKVTVAGIQTKVGHDLNANLEKTIKMIRQAAKRGAQIVCLQELFHTPYFPLQQHVDTKNFIETIPGKITQRLSKLARELGIVLIVPLFEQAKNGKYYNTAVVINEKGKLIDSYRKIHIPEDPGFFEKDYFEHGNSGYKIFKTIFGTFAVLICYDQWFPEAARMVKLAGAEIIFYPTAVGDIIGYKERDRDWHEAWETIQRGHAIANAVYVVPVNRVGVEGKTKFWGQSFVANSFGHVLKRASADKEEILLQTIDLTMNKFIEDGWGFLRNRRPDTYKLNSKKLVEKSKALKDVPNYAYTKKLLGLK